MKTKTSAYVHRRHCVHKLIKLNHGTTLVFVIDVSATPVAFLGMVLITSAHCQMSRRTGFIDVRKLIGPLVSVHRLACVYYFFNPPIHFVAFSVSLESRVANFAINFHSSQSHIYLWQPVRCNIWRQTEVIKTIPMKATAIVETSITNTRVVSR